MSQNPYQSSPLPGSPMPSPAAVASQQKPGGLTAIAVICLILGIMGVLGSIFVVAMAFLQGTINELQNAQGGPGAEIQAKMQEVQQAQFIPNLLLGGCNLLVGSLLALGGIGVLSLKESGRSLLRNALLIAIVFVVLRGAYGIWNSFVFMGALEGVGDANMQAGIKFGMIVGMVISLLVPAVLVGFYFWSRWYLGKPNIKAFFAAAN